MNAKLNLPVHNRNDEVPEWAYLSRQIYLHTKDTENLQGIVDALAEIEKHQEIGGMFNSKEVAWRFQLISEQMNLLQSCLPDMRELALSFLNGDNKGQ